MAKETGKPVAAPPAPPAAPQQHAMFSTLVASKPPKEGGWAAGATSVLLHVGLVALLLWATMAAGNEPEEEQITLIEIPTAEEEAPPPPPPPPPPPMEETPPPMDDIDVPQGFQTLDPPTIIPPDIPPPSVGQDFDASDYSGVGVEGGRADGNPDREVTVEDIDAAPRMTPFTVAPVLRNTEEVRRALVRFYPPLLRDAGIGGRVLLWFLIDEEGNVVRTQVKETSGHQGLDDAAGRVAELMEFSPAMNRDRRARVWVSIPIDFRPVNN